MISSIDYRIGIVDKTLKRIEEALEVNGAMSVTDIINVIHIDQRFTVI